MKKFLAFIIIVGLLAGGYGWLKKHGQLNITSLAGETDVVKRGDLEVPITASGRIEPARIAKIKGEATGVVRETPQRIGEMVKQGDLIVLIDREDEQRNVDRAEADYERTKIALERARLAREEAEKVGLPMAQADLDQVTARLEYVRIEHTQKAAKLERAEDVLSRQEFETVEARLKETQAAVAAATAKVRQAEMALRYADKDVATMEQNERVALKTLQDAQERLAETEVRAPMDGMILRRLVEAGEVVQSGKSSIMGGDVLLELADISNIYAVVNVDEADIGMVRELAPEEARPGPASMPAAPLADAGRGDRAAADGDAATAQTTGGDAEDSAEEGEPGEPLREIEQGVLDTDQMVEVTVESFPGERFHGAIERIAPQSELSQAIATFKVWIRITSENRHLLTGLLNVQAEAHFTAKSVRDALLVSYDAFQREGDDFGVYVPVKDPKPGQKKYEFRRCEFGRDNGMVVEVRSGLEEGEQVYTKLPIQTRKEEKAAEEAED